MTFASMRARITRQHLGWQVPLWVGYGLLWLVCVTVLQPLGWMASEASSQAIVGAKKIFAPLLWPLLIIAALAVMLVAMGTQQFAQLMGPLLQFGIYLVVIGFVIYAIKQSLWPSRRNRR